MHPREFTERERLIERQQRREAQRKEERERKAEERRKAEKQEEDKVRAQVEAAVLNFIADDQLDSATRSKIVNRVLSEFNKWCKHGVPNAFPWNGEVRRIRYEMGIGAGVAPVAPNQNPLAQQLPPPAPEGKRPLHDPDVQRRNEQHREMYEAGRRLNEQERADRDAYEKYLQKYGLTSASIGIIPGGGGLSGLGR